MGAFVICAYALTWVLLGPWFYVFNVKLFTPNVMKCSNLKTFMTLFKK